MNGDIKVSITVYSLRAMNEDQFKALKENVLADGIWENARGVNISAGGDYAIVEPLDSDGQTMIHLGIEKDGYTHS